MGSDLYRKIKDSLKERIRKRKARVDTGTTEFLG